MQIQIHSDKTIEGSERLHAYLSGELETALARFESKIMRVEVQLGDENKDKFDTKDKRCMIEARLAGTGPIAVTHFADTVEKAFHGASEKLKHALGTTFEKMRNH
ncbi:MAG: HPF/RaiA family ribosome-associated protein [Flavobacterium sp.]|nr:MAG: HPF/RaiA family ribosome-associated protein [Flavobacterium sp.]